MINQVVLVGRVGKDATVTKTSTGKKMIKFILATWISIKDETHESGWRTITEWHNIVCWSDFADNLAEKLKKGKMVVVNGSIKYRDYEDKEGVKRYITEIIGQVKPVGQDKKDKEDAEEKLGISTEAIQSIISGNKLISDLGVKKDDGDLLF